MTDDRLNETLQRLRRRFGIPEPPALPDRARPAPPPRGVWPLDSIRDTAAALAARHRIDPARYRDSAWYRRQVDAHTPAYARALCREQPPAAIQSKDGASEKERRGTETPPYRKARASAQASEQERKGSGTPPPPLKEP